MLKIKKNLLVVYISYKTSFWASFITFDKVYFLVIFVGNIIIEEIEEQDQINCFKISNLLLMNKLKTSFSWSFYWFSFDIYANSHHELFGSKSQDKRGEEISSDVNFSNSHEKTILVLKIPLDVNFGIKSFSRRLV